MVGKAVAVKNKQEYFAARKNVLNNRPMIQIDFEMSFVD
jgi:hypothetical protein